jgi:hypothetical protein
MQEQKVLHCNAEVAEHALECNVEAAGATLKCRSIRRYTVMQKY